MDTYCVRNSALIVLMILALSVWLKPTFLFDIGGPTTFRSKLSVEDAHCGITLVLTQAFEYATRHGKHFLDGLTR